jgi:hypothetical protein
MALQKENMKEGSRLAFMRELLRVGEDFHMVFQDNFALLEVGSKNRI